MRALPIAALVALVTIAAVERHAQGARHAGRTSAPAWCWYPGNKVHQARERPIGLPVETGRVGFFAFSP